MAWFRKVKAGLVKQPVEKYKGKQEGELFFDVETGVLYLTKDADPGGKLVYSKEYIDSLGIDAATLNGFKPSDLSTGGGYVYASDHYDLSGLSQTITHGMQTVLNIRVHDSNGTDVITEITIDNDTVSVNSVIDMTGLVLTITGIN